MSCRTDVIFVRLPLLLVKQAYMEMGGAAFQLPFGGFNLCEVYVPVVVTQLKQLLDAEKEAPQIISARKGLHLHL
jgi:hypothetical protein